MTEREILIQELRKLPIKYSNPCVTNERCREILAEWIEDDRRRICAPLIKYKRIPIKYGNWGNTFVCKAIDKVLTLAGLDKD